MDSRDSKINESCDLLQTHVTADIIHSYQKLAQELAIALCKEEKRCCYLTEQANMMLDTLENGEKLA